jgi:DNA modification methylase
MSKRLESDGEFENSSEDEAFVWVGGDPVTVRGDLWKCGKHSVHCGDARKRMSFRILKDGQRADLIFTDAPYNVRISGHVSGKGRYQHGEFAMASGEMPDREFVEFLFSVIRNALEHASANALQYYFMDWRHLGHLSQAALLNGLVQINLCVWVKSNGGMGSLYRSQHELVSVFAERGARHTNNVQLGKFGRNRSNVWNYPGANSLRGEHGRHLLITRHRNR